MKKLCVVNQSTSSRLSRSICSSVLVAAVVIAGCDSTDVGEIPSSVQESPIGDSASSPDPGSGKAVSSDSKARAALPSLAIGDPAPPLQVDQWVLGEPVDPVLNGGVFVVEFWATWCGPCRVGMPHISELQQHHGDAVKFVGVTREDVETVEGFLDSDAPDGRLWRELVQYRMVTDLDGATNVAYMQAANQNGIPTAFIVGREGIVEWIGHPMNIDLPLQQVVDGAWDRDAAIAEFQQQQRMQEFAAQIRPMLQKQQWDQALDALDGLEQEIGKNASLLKYRLMILQQSGNEEQTAPIRAELVELVWDNPSALNAIAWEIASSRQAGDLELAKRAAERASKLREDKDASILDTVARVHYELRDLDQAIHWQRLAVENNSGIDEINETLETYLAEQKELAAPDTTEPEPEPSDSVDSDSEKTNDDLLESDGAESEDSPDAKNSQEAGSQEAVPKKHSIDWSRHRI